MIYNKNLLSLRDYPFEKLAKLLQNVQPNANLDIINMSIGEPTEQVIDEAKQIIEENSHLWNKYPSVIGIPELREAICSFLNRRFLLEKTKICANENIIATNGTREALFMIGSLMGCNAEKPFVLMADPFYNVYVGAAKVNNMQPFFIEANEENSFQPDFNSLPKDVLAKTHYAFICSPSNPQGKVMDMEKLKQAIKLAREYNFTLIIDECYSEIYRHTPPKGGLNAVEALGGALDNVLIVNSLSKRSNAAGIRSGFVAGDKKLMEKFKIIRNYGGAAIPLPIQMASCYLWNDEEHVKKVRAFYNKNYQVAEEILASWHDFYIPEGGFYLWLKVKNADETTKILWQKQAIKVIPGHYFSHLSDENSANQYIRIALVNNFEKIQKGLTRLQYTKDEIT